MKTDGNLRKVGSNYYYLSGKFFGTLHNSIGAYGDSTGEFRRCTSTCPLNELGVVSVNGCAVQPYE